MTSLRPLSVLLLSLMVLGSGAPPAALATGGIPAAGPADMLPADAGRADTVYYVNKTGNVPSVGGAWDAAAWQKGRMYDLSNGQGRCLMYIMFTVGAGSTKLFIGVDVVADTTSADNGILEIAFDGDNDGKVTYENTDPNGSELGVLWPKTLGGPVVDRWAQIRDNGANEAGWSMMWCNTVQLWRVTGGYESGDGMFSGFSAHRFYEYSTDYSRNLGLSEDAVFGMNLRVTDPVIGIFQLPGNYSGAGGPFSKFALAQSPVAGILSPVANNYYYKGDQIDFDGSASTDDELSSLKYLWTFDEGGPADTMVARHNFTTTGRHTARLDVSDADGLKDTAVVAFNVKEKNQPPVISAFQPPSDPTINETEAITFELTILDVNIVQGVGESVWVNWTLNDKKVRTGLAYPRSNYTFTSDYDGPASAGTYFVNVSVQDNYDGGSPEPTVRGWVVTVNNKNRPPQITMAEPDVDQIAVPESGNLSLSVEYTDPDGDNVTAQWYADNETLPGTRNRGSIIWRPDHNSSGVHELKVALTDKNGGLTERPWAVLVTNVDRPPAITSAAPSQREVSLREGAELKFSIVKFDPDMEPISVQWYVETTPMPGTNSTLFLFNATYEGAFSSEGSPYAVKVVIRDPFGLSAERSWQVTVEDVNRLPVALIDEPADESDFGLGATVKVRGDRSWDPDSADNGSLQYIWDFGDGKTGNGPSGSHKYERTGPYTIRLTVRDRTAASSSFVHVNIRAPILWVTDLLVSPSVNIREDRSVNVTVRVSNTGDADARDIRIRLSVDNLPVATLSLPSLPAGERDEVMFAWPAVRGDHTLRASIEPASGLIVPDGSASEKSLSVKARPIPAAQGLPSWILGLGGAFAALIVVSAVGWVVLSRRRKAPRPAPSRASDGKLSPDAALAALTNAPAPEAAVGTQPLLSQDPALGPAADAGTPAGTSGPAAPDAMEAPAPGAEAKAPPAAAEPPEAPAPVSTGSPAGPADAAEAAGTAPAAEPDAPPAPVAPLKCPTCDEALEPGWKLCPACGSKLDEAKSSAPAAPSPEPPSAESAAAFAEAVSGIRNRIEVLSALDKDVSGLQSTLDLAASFHRTGKSEKAQKYLDKAKEMLAELDSN